MICNGVITSAKILESIEEFAGVLFEELKGEAYLSDDQIIQAVKDPLDNKIKEVTESYRHHFADFFNKNSTDFQSVVTYERGSLNISMNTDMQNFLRYVDEQVI